MFGIHSECSIQTPSPGLTHPSPGWCGISRWRLTAAPLAGNCPRPQEQPPLRLVPQIQDGALIPTCNSTDILTHLPYGNCRAGQLHHCDSRRQGGRSLKNWRQRDVWDVRLSKTFQKYLLVYLFVYLFIYLLFPSSCPSFFLPFLPPFLPSLFPCFLPSFLPSSSLCLKLPSRPSTLYSVLFFWQPFPGSNIMFFLCSPTVYNLPLPN